VLLKKTKFKRTRLFNRRPRALLTIRLAMGGATHMTVLGHAADAKQNCTTLF